MVRKVQRQTIAAQEFPPEMIAAMEAFLDYMAVRNYSHHTITERRYYIGLFTEWADARGVTRPEEVTLRLLESYQRHVYQYRQMNGKPLSVLGQRSRLLALTAWFKWLAAQKLLDSDPASQMILPKRPKYLPRAILTREEVEKVLTQPRVEGALGLRDRAMMELFYSTAIRRTEMTQLRLKNLDVDRRTIQVLEGKGGKDRYVPIGKRALEWLHAYLENSRPLLLVDPYETTIFITRNGVPFVPNALSDLVRKYIKAAGITKGGGCHLFRHTAATLMMENGADIRAIQALLGHSDLNATQLYTHVTINQLRKVHDETHPAKPEPSIHHDEDDDDEAVLVAQ